MFSRRLQFSLFIFILIKTIIANSQDEYVTNFSRTSSYVSKQATNREELDRSSNLDKELAKLRANIRDPCGGGRLQHSANLQDGSSGSIACTSSDHKITSDKLRDVDFSKTGLSKLNLGSTSSHHDVASSKLTSSSIASSKTYSTSKTSSLDSTPLDRYTSYSSSTNIKTDLPSYSRYTDNNSKTNHIKTDLNLDRPSNYFVDTPTTSSSIYPIYSNLNINTNSGQLASKLTSQIDAANTHLDTSSKILSQQNIGAQSTIGRSIHGLHSDTHSLSNAQNQHYATSTLSKTYGGSSSVDFSGLNYSKTKVTDHSHLHTDVSKTNQPAYTKTFDIKGGTTIHTHNDKLRIHDHSIKGAPLKDHGTSVLITEEEERRIEAERRKNIVRLNSSDKLNSHISTNKTDTYLYCESGEMLVKINFTKKFHGIVYANSRDSACRILGNGERSYELHIPLNACGTKKDGRLFVNNITVRFHQTLELEEDEIKTIICRYPPPAAPLPVIPLRPVIRPSPPAPIIASKLSEIELILVICFLLFLPILLLGIGISYYGLKRRNIKIIRKRRLYDGAPSQITKISHSTFEPVRIPRVAVSDYTSESETRTILSDSSSLRRDQYHNQKLQHIPELKVQLLDTTYLANQRFVEEETENIINKKTTTNYFKKVPPLPPASIPDNDCWSHSEFTDIAEQREVTITKPIAKPTYHVRTEKEHFIDLEKDMSIEERLIKNKNITLPPPPPPKYQVKNINDTFITNIKETATSCEKLCDYVSNNQEWQSQHGGNSQRSADRNYLSRSSSLKYEDSFLYERKYNCLKNLFDQPLPSSVSPPKAGFSYLTADEKTRWYNLITTDESFRSLMIESSTYEEYINVSRDLRYEHYFSKKTWETIINTLTNREIIARWNANVYEDQKFNDNVELSFNSETQELLKQSSSQQQQQQKQFGGSETISYSKQINKLVDGARERLMEQQFESSQSVYRSGGGGGGLVSIPRLSSTRTAEHKSLLDQEEVKSVTETSVDDHYYKRTLRK